MKNLFSIFTSIIISTSAFAALPASVPSLAPMLEKTTPAVVNIATRGTVTVQRPRLFDDPFFQRFFDVPNQPRQRETRSLGSGVIVDAKQGYLLTNHHVIDGAQVITVILNDGRELNAELVGSDPDSDVAVLKVEAADLTELPLANSDELRVGDFVVAIGNPFGLGQTVTSGIVSALSRSGLGIENYEDFIQTDASINPGNSGGALVNLQGELVGINTAILGQSGNIGIGFAIPVNMAKQIMEQLLDGGEVKRGRLGVNVQNLSADLARAFNLHGSKGVVITNVERDSPAEKAGLRAGDVVLEVDGRQIRGVGAMRNVIGLLRVGQAVTLKILREGETKTVRAEIASTEAEKILGSKLSGYLKGALLANITVQSRNHQRGAVEISEIEFGGAAWRAGLRRGDFILSLNRQKVESISELKQVIAGQKNQLLLNIQRGRSALFILLK